MARNRHHNKHHVLYESAVWRSRDDTRTLRNKPGLIIPLDIDVHRDLHRNITSVPVPDRYMAARVLRTFKPARHILDTMDILCHSFYEATEHPRATKLEQELGHLIISSIEAQREYIAQGMIYEGR